MNASDADVMLCPGDRTHFQIMQREGVPDVTVYHPGLLEAPVGLEDAQRFFVALGVGKIAVPPRWVLRWWDLSGVWRRIRVYLWPWGWARLQCQQGGFRMGA